MSRARGIAFNLDQLGFDAYGRVCIRDEAVRSALQDVLDQADALACQTGCGLPSGCETALLTREEFTQFGRDLLVSNADFAQIIRKRKAMDALETVIVFTGYKAVDLN